MRTIEQKITFQMTKISDEGLIKLAHHRASEWDITVGVDHFCDEASALYAMRHSASPEMNDFALNTKYWWRRVWKSDAKKIGSILAAPLVEIDRDE